MFERLKRKLLFSLAVSAIVFLALSFYADWNDLSQALLDFDWIYLPVALLLALVNYGLRFFRWQYYLHQLAIPLPWRESVVVFLAGLILSVTPGKPGELLKAYFIRERLQTPISQSVPAVIGERLTDLIALILLALAGVYAYQVGLVPLIIAGILVLSGVAALGVPGLMSRGIGLFESLPNCGPIRTVRAKWV